MEKKWAFRPGEKKPKDVFYTKESEQDFRVEAFRSLIKEHGEFVNNHLAVTDSPKTAVMSDGHEIVYFVNLDEDFKRQGVEVAIYTGDGFSYLPEDMADSLADKYFSYIDMIGELSGIVDGGRTH